MFFLIESDTWGGRFVDLLTDEEVKDGSVVKAISSDLPYTVNMLFNNG